LPPTAGALGKRDKTFYPSGTAKPIHFGYGEGEKMKQQIDWGLLKIQYEIFGETTESLADQYNTTPRMIEYAVEEGKWQHKPIAKAIQAWEEFGSIEELPPDLLDEVQSRMQILFTLKQSTLNPRYIAIEAAILGKAQQVVRNLNPEDPNAADVLSSMAKVFTALRETAGITGSNSEDKGKSITVKILSKVGNDRQEQVAATGVEVAIADAA
jgi:hypothetical protein